MIPINPNFVEMPKEEFLKSPNLIQMVGDILIGAGLTYETEVFFYPNKWIIDAIKLPLEGQRFLLNRYWTAQLMAHPGNTIDMRFYLITDGTIDDWLYAFKEKILPFCIENRLPKYP